MDRPANANNYAIVLSEGDIAEEGVVCVSKTSRSQYDNQSINRFTDDSIRIGRLLQPPKRFCKNTLKGHIHEPFR